MVKGVSHLECMDDFMYLLRMCQNFILWLLSRIRPFFWAKCFVILVMLSRFFMVVAKLLSKGCSVGVWPVQVNLRAWKSRQNLVLPLSILMNMLLMKKKHLSNWKKCLYIFLWSWNVHEQDLYLVYHKMWSLFSHIVLDILSKSWIKMDVPLKKPSYKNNFPSHLHMPLPIIVLKARCCFMS